ncbi:MAG: HPF/RaiA family ribosome-associated protein [Gammaproteobacteria bacterium]|nr:HPF/RaiA family ribosome-associated protein [Gammaproteobacteria bacterium]
MISDFQILFHKIDQSHALVQAVQKRINKLGRFCDQIMSGRVVLDSPHNYHLKGKVYSVSIEIHTAFKKVIVNQEQHNNHAHEDLYIAIRDAFDIAERQLKSADKKYRIERIHKVQGFSDHEAA